MRVNACTHAHCWAGERAREVAQLTLQALEDGAKSVMQEAQVLESLGLLCRLSCCSPCMRVHVRDGIISATAGKMRCVQHDRICYTGMLGMLTHCAERVCNDTPVRAMTRVRAKPSDAFRLSPSTLYPRAGARYQILSPVICFGPRASVCVYLQFRTSNASFSPQPCTEAKHRFHSSMVCVCVCVCVCVSSHAYRDARACVLHPEPRICVFA